MKRLLFDVNYLHFTQASEEANFLITPTMLNIGCGQNDSELSDLKSYYSNLATVTLNDSINIPEGASNWDVSQAGNGTVMAYVVENMEKSTAEKTMYDLHLEGDGGISAPVYSNDLFRLTSSPTNISTYTNIEGLNLLNTSKVTDMSLMFRECSNLTSLDLSSFDTSKVTNMQDMFYKCSSLTNLDLSIFDTSKVTNMSSMFCICNNLKNLDLKRATFNSNLTSSSMFTSVPSGINIIVKDETAKIWIETKKSNANIVIA